MQYFSSSAMAEQVRSLKNRIAGALIDLAHASPDQARELARQVRAWSARLAALIDLRAAFLDRDTALGLVWARTRRKIRGRR